MDNGLVGSSDLKAGVRDDIAQDLVEKIPQDVGIEEASRILAAALSAKRENLDADKLCSMEGLDVRVEQHYPQYEAWLMSICGFINGVRYEGCLFAGQCILVYAPTLAEARTMAMRGLEDTREMLVEHHWSPQEERSVADATVIESTRDMGDLKTLPKLKAIMAHIIGGKPWKW